MPEFAKQNFYYYEAARVNDAETNSILLRVMPFKRQGAYISVSEQSNALIYRSVAMAARDSWVTERKDTVRRLVGELWKVRARTLGFCHCA